jgi:germination protein M
VRVYFLRGEKLGVAERRVPAMKAVATAAMQALCGGVTAEEQAAGLGSAVPAGTRLLALSLADGVATVDLSGEFASGGGSLSMAARVAQVVYTLTQYPTVKSVDFRMDGAPLRTLGGEGLMLDPGQTRADWQALEPVIFVERPGVGAVLNSPFVLQGSAVVFEGAFMARLQDESGKRIVGTPVQASAGGPERGDFRTAVPFSTTATSGTLVVYDQSMKDGSRQDEVRIPVTFAP